MLRVGSFCTDFDPGWYGGGGRARGERPRILAGDLEDLTKWGFANIHARGSGFIQGSSSRAETSPPMYDDEDSFKSSAP